MLKEIYEESHDMMKPSKVNLRSKVLGPYLNIMIRMIAGKRYYGKNMTNEEARQFQEVIQEMLDFHGVVICEPGRRYSNL